MEITTDEIQRFKKAFEKDTGILLNDSESKESLENLINYFDLLWRWDCEDKQKLMEMKGLQNGSNNL